MLIVVREILLKGSYLLTISIGCGTTVLQNCCYNECLIKQNVRSLRDE